jgi:hypothetical protein
LDPDRSDHGFRLGGQRLPIRVPPMRGDEGEIPHVALRDHRVGLGPSWACSRSSRGARRYGPRSPRPSERRRQCTGASGTSGREIVLEELEPAPSVTWDRAPRHRTEVATRDRLSAFAESSRRIATGTEDRNERRQDPTRSMIRGRRGRFEFQPPMSLTPGR